MRRLDWALAAVIAAFLIGALAIETTGGWASRLGGAHLPGLAPVDVSLRRLAPRLPPAIFPGDPR